MIRIGFILLIVGFLGAAYVASLDPDSTDWMLFLPAAAVALTGVFMIRHSRSAALKDTTVLQGNRLELESSLASIVGKLETLETRKGDIPPYEMRFEIDRLFREDLRRFADARHSLSQLYGMQAYADIVSDFAAGERYLNRVWSASADGYVDEVRSYVTRALAQFRHASGRLRQVQADAA